MRLMAARYLCKYKYTYTGTRLVQEKYLQETVLQVRVPVHVHGHVHGHIQVRVHVYTLNTEKVPTKDRLQVQIERINKMPR